MYNVMECISVKNVNIGNSLIDKEYVISYVKRFEAHAIIEIKQFQIEKILKNSCTSSTVTDYIIIKCKICCFGSNNFLY